MHSPARIPLHAFPYVPRCDVFIMNLHVSIDTAQVCEPIILYTLHTPFIHLYYHSYTYVHPLYHVYTPYIHPTHL